MIFTDAPQKLAERLPSWPASGVMGYLSSAKAPDCDGLIRQNAGPGLQVFTMNPGSGVTESVALEVDSGSWMMIALSTDHGLGEALDLTAKGIGLMLYFFTMDARGTVLHDPM